MSKKNQEPEQDERDDGPEPDEPGTSPAEIERAIQDAENAYEARLNAAPDGKPLLKPKKKRVKEPWEFEDPIFKNGEWTDCYGGADYQEGDD